MSQDTLALIEHFDSIQGEGSRVGEPSTFLRLAGCNLRCSWCDTPYSWNAEGMRSATRMTIDEIVSVIGEDAVVITGGEPMLHHRHLPTLIDAIRARTPDAPVTIETNATVAVPDWHAIVDLWSLSPKLPGSGEATDIGVLSGYLATVDPRSRQLKFVIADLDRDWDAMWAILDEVVAAGEASERLQVIVQPDGLRDDYEAALRELSEHVLADELTWSASGRPRRSHVRVIPQTHRIAWGAQVRGV